MLPSPSRIEPPPAYDLVSELTGLADLSARLGAVREPAGILQLLSDRLHSIFAVDSVGILRLDGDRLTSVAATGIGTGGQLGLFHVPLAESPLMRGIFATGLPLVVDDLARDMDTAPDMISLLGFRSGVFVPIPDGATGMTSWGVIAMVNRGERHFTDVEVERIMVVAGQTGLALSNASLVSQSSRWTGHLEGIEALSRALNRGRDVQAVADLLAREIDKLIEWDGLRFYVLQPDGVTLEAVTLRGKVPEYASETVEAVRLRLGEGLGGTIAQAGVGEIIGDVLRDPRMLDIPGSEDFDESMIVVPLRFEDRILGVVELSRLGLDRFDAYDLRLAQILAAQAAVALVNAGHVEELERRSARLERQLVSQRQLLAITERLLKTGDRSSIFAAIAETLAEVVPYDAFTIYLTDRRKADALVAVFARDPYADDIVGSQLPAGAGITGDVVARGEAELVQDANRDPRAVVVPGTPDDQHESLIVAPLRSPIGVIGSLNVYRIEREFDEDDLALTMLFANHAAIALENAQVHEQLLVAARTDPLTGLPNRALFRERVEEALARRRRSSDALAVLFLDLDEFKTINDSLGHAAGDEVLKVLASRLRGSLRTTDTVARLGGDEFAVLLEGISARQPMTAAERITEVLREPLVIDGRTVNVEASVGVAITMSAVGKDRPGEADRIGAEELLRDADVAMYRAKAGGKGRFVQFEQGMHEEAMARLDLEVALRHAIATNAFKLMYQPVVELRTGRIRAVEALLRWDHPTRGPLPPIEFVPLAEDTGLIRPIGHWVLREACRQLQAWRRAGRVDPTLTMTVNVSARQLADRAFLDEVREALVESGLSPGCLQLEITESALMDHDGHAVSTLLELRKLGVRVAVDDFGTGYSSLSTIKLLPVDALKIDRSFLEGLGTDREDTGIVSAIVAFGSALGLVVTAEGIETVAQMEALDAIGCDLGQGYLFGAAMEPAEAERYTTWSRPAAA